MNQIFQWSFQYPILAALAACIALSVINNLLFNILQIIENVMARFQWWMIAGRFRDKEGYFTHENLDNFIKLVDKIDGNDEHQTNKESREEVSG